MKRFSVWAPEARSADLVFAATRYAMTRDAAGWWHVEAPSAEAVRGYRFSLDGGAPLPDPRSQWQPQGVHGPSYLVDHDAYAWQHPSFRPGPVTSAVVYELHIGTFTPEGTYRAAIEKLDHLADLGVTHVEVMPVAQFPGSRGWGYDGVDLFAPHHAYGSPEDLKAFVDACHGRGLAVLLDVVYNHLGPDGNYLGSYGPYFTASFHTPWGDAVNLDQDGSTEVRRFIIDNALMWLRDYRFDGLRLDAVHGFGDRSAVHLLEQMAVEVEALSVSLGKDLALIAESDLNDPRLLWSRERGGYQLHAAWSDDFHHAVHTALTGETAGFFADYARLTDLAKALTDVYVYDGCYSRFRGRNHGRAIGEVSPRRFVVESQNHDQIGNRARGERLEHLAGLDAAKIAAGLTLTAPNIPLLFQGEEWAASSPFQYFTDHQDAALAQAVSEGRRHEFAAFGWDPKDVPDPQDVATFNRSKLNWQEIADSPHSDMLGWYKQLTAYRKRFGHLLAAPVTESIVGEKARTLQLRRGSFQLALNLGDTTLEVLAPDGITDLIASRPAEEQKGVLALPPMTFACFVHR